MRSRLVRVVGRAVVLSVAFWRAVIDVFQRRAQLGEVLGQRPCGGQGVVQPQGRRIFVPGVAEVVVGVRTGRGGLSFLRSAERLFWGDELAQRPAMLRLFIACAGMLLRLVFGRRR